ncbi:MAG: asparagine synthase B [Bacteroidetes bacterium 4572_117]|nr:MAG: asparagine synthase B [Bacteroidetes bacterium 4572_117]
MCGILAVIGKSSPEEVGALSKRMTHRGPDENGLVQTKNGSVLSHERLSIIDLNTGVQPIQSDNDEWMVHNGEIYNHEEIRKQLNNYPFKTKSDSEVIVALYKKYGFEFCNSLDGVFAFVIVDGDTFMAARDPIGVKPLYYGVDKSGKMYFASEMKAISDQCFEMEAFPPGHYYTPQTGFVKYYKPNWENPFVAKEKTDLKKLKNALITATKKRLMTDVPLGVLLSGGLDSSLIASITKRLLPEDSELHSFSVGVDESSPDLIAAKKVADFIGTTHHNVVFSVEEGIEAIKKIIWHLETYDVTTIRAATPMYFLSKYIKLAGIKTVLSGEGADEIFGGYLYFHDAPNTIEFQKELIRRVKNLSTADCLRADKSTMAHGIEARVPFLDKDFLDTAMHIQPSDKQPDRTISKPEKHILRAAFDEKENPYLPDEVLWRQKEQFSDGIGYSWIDTLRQFCVNTVNDKQFAQAKKLYPHNTPTTKEAFYFRQLFEEMYPQLHALKTVKKWIPKWQENEDPSGRASLAHNNNLITKTKRQRRA